MHFLKDLIDSHLFDISHGLVHRHLKPLATMCVYQRFDIGGCVSAGM